MKKNKTLGDKIPDICFYLIFLPVILTKNRSMPIRVLGWILELLWVWVGVFLCIPVELIGIVITVFELWDL
jgi:hypothetical protein